ncbi:MAG TPA: NADH-quinone oxidoreductase subunit D [Planctomycetota bacterium]|nr:NADH-quinone oxidoreductase subunit D [Planctomycetota bacterium]
MATSAKPLETQDMLLNMGPQHPSTHGVLRLMIRTDGEMVSECTPVVGYLHRCAEKIGENLRYEQYVPYTDRMDYLSSMSDNLGFCLAVEKLLTIEIPARSQAIRVIMAELNRVASHLLAFGTFGLDIGAFTPFLYAFRERELILNMFEYVSGARLTYNYVKVGGVMKDVDKKFGEMVFNFLNQFDARLKDYDELLTYNQIFITRTKGLGIFSPKLAVDYGLTGPNLRASGISYDIRKAMPYSGYEKYSFDVILGRDCEQGVLGDCWNRYRVRILEMIESCKIIRQAMEGLPAGKFAADLRKIKPAVGEAYTVIENPRGELGFYIMSDGSETPTRVRVRAPSFVNLAIMPEVGKNQLIADLIAILGSIDIVLGEIDR